MTNRPLPIRALWNALGATAYIAAVAAIFHFRLFGGHGEETIFTQIAALLLVVLSVMMMGTLLLVPPLRLYLDGHKSDGVRLLAFEVMWLGTVTLLAMIVMSLM
ncbi:MAG: hypothetical protein ACOZB3_00425 [Calditrichota bacterium]